MESCKKNGNYLSGNINLSTLSAACPDDPNTSPYWIGVFREKYLKTDQGNEFIEMRMRKIYYLLVNSNSKFCWISVYSVKL